MAVGPALGTASSCRGMPSGPKVTCSCVGSRVGGGGKTGLDVVGRRIVGTMAVDTEKGGSEVVGTETEESRVASRVLA